MKVTKNKLVREVTEHAGVTILFLLSLVLLSLVTS